MQLAGPGGDGRTYGRQGHVAKGEMSLVQHHFCAHLEAADARHACGTVVTPTITNPEDHAPSEQGVSSWSLTLKTGVIHFPQPVPGTKRPTLSHPESQRKQLPER